MKNVVYLLCLLLIPIVLNGQLSEHLIINDNEYFEKQGWNVFVFNNWYDGNFSDAKIAGIEFIHHGIRTVTNGDIRLKPTPGQWDSLPQFVSKKIDKKAQQIDVNLRYPSYNFNYTIRVAKKDKGILLSVILEKPLPPALVGKAGLNLEFLPSAYFERTYFADEQVGIFPLYPSGTLKNRGGNEYEPEPFAVASKFVFAPEDPMRTITIQGINCILTLYDGRQEAQNGWYVLRTLVPSGKKGKVIEWYIEATTIPKWIRTPVIGYSQVGYHPKQRKIAILEFDKNDTPKQEIRLIRYSSNGSQNVHHSSSLKIWGQYLRYNYAIYDFTEVQDEGLYVIQFDTLRTPAFKISRDVYEKVWYPTIDVFFPVQMDHMFVREAYRVWHGLAHMDDAIQAPPNHIHFDLYAMGSTTDSPFQPFEHIPGLNVGGWFDAGDFDIRTQTHYLVVQTLSHVWEDFKPMRDQTTIDQVKRYVEIHKPDGKPDFLQQIEHGVLALIAQFRVFGHAIPGIVEGSLSQYTHLGDAASQTDNYIYSKRLNQFQTECDSSGVFDDRWAFTTRTTALNYGSIAALAAASRVLKGYNDTLAQECITIAEKIWDEEHSRPPSLFRHGNTTGGDVKVEEFKASTELLICTNKNIYRQRAEVLFDSLDNNFSLIAPFAVRAHNYFNMSFVEKIRNRTIAYKQYIDSIKSDNPFGVPITRTGWAGNNFIVNYAINNYYLNKCFPDIISLDDALTGLNYLFGCHPYSNISFVSSVGTVSKKIAYGNNRADFSFIAGGVVPGVLILNSDFPENKEDWPFFWGQNEYVINIASTYIYLTIAVHDALNKQ